MIDLTETTRALLAEGKGILAADESTESANKRLALYGIEGTEESRRAFRDLFLNAPGCEAYLSGVILYKETLMQDGLNKVNFAKSLLKRGILAGIKVDEGTEPITDKSEELITKGVLGLCDRLVGYHEEYKTSFTKWRAVITIEGTQLPTNEALVENARRLAVYARDAQEVRMVPLIEPEVLYAGNHSRVRAKEVLTDTLNAVFAALTEHSVDMSGILLKTAMVLSGKDSKKKDSPEEVASDTLDVLMATVPKEVPGIVFLSGGQTPDQATENLRALCAEAKKRNAPWKLTFSYARALQEEAIDAWGGKAENVDAARAVFLERLKKVSEALG